MGNARDRKNPCRVRGRILVTVRKEFAYRVFARVWAATATAVAMAIFVDTPDSDYGDSELCSSERGG
jgi:hypothetical protein